MTLSGILVKKIPIISDGSVLYDTISHKPYNGCNISPAFVKTVDLENGEWGAVGSVIVVGFILDGIAKVAKEVIVAIDDEKKSVSYNVIGGDILDAYKTFLISFQVDTSTLVNFVTLTFQYEKLNENIPDPQSLMDLSLIIISAIENFAIST